jgi:hypothetical protein
VETNHEERVIFVGEDTGTAIAVFHECLHWLSHPSFQEAAKQLPKRERQAMFEVRIPAMWMDRSDTM